MVKDDIEKIKKQSVRIQAQNKQFLLVSGNLSKEKLEQATELVIPTVII